MLSSVKQFDRDCVPGWLTGELEVFVPPTHPRFRNAKVRDVPLYLVPKYSIFKSVLIRNIGIKSVLCIGEPVLP